MPAAELRAEFRSLLVEGWDRLYRGEVAPAAAACERARALSEEPIFDDVDRADALFRLGACRLKLGKVANAVSLLTAAAALAERVQADRVRGQALEWRSRCYQLQRDWEAAGADAELAVELGRGLGDPRLEALATMQCSLVAERSGDALLARFHAKRARELAAEAGDRRTEARLLNNLGGLSFLVGEADVAVSYLKQAFALSLELGNHADAAQAVSSLAQVHLRDGAPILAEEQARHALSLLDGRADYRDERGNAHLVLARALLDQDRDDEAEGELDAADLLFAVLGSASHIAAAWVARGDACRRRGDLERAATLYRRAAARLQDFHF
jgi:tetratricopeptide (TPR) repeat protein